MHAGAAGNGEGGAGPVPVAGPNSGSSATFKLPLAAGIGSGVATQVVGPTRKRSGSSSTEDDAVVVGMDKFQNSKHIENKFTSLIL